MTLARWQNTITDEEGNVLPGASVEVRREVGGSPLAALYTDRDGVTPAGNPLTADGDGFVGFHVAGGAFRVTATLGAFSRVWRYVGIGTASELDASAEGVALIQAVDAGYALNFETATAAPPSSGAIRFDNADLSIATEAYVSVENAGGSDIKNLLLDLFDVAHTRPDTFIISDPNSNKQAAFDVTGAVSDGSPATYITLSLTGHSGETSFSAGSISFQRDRAGADGADGVVSTANSPNANEFARFTDATTIEGLTVSEARTALSLTDEDIQDLVGAMVSSNTETNVTVTYQDSDGTVDFVVADASEGTAGAIDLATDAEIRAAATGSHALTAEDLETAAALVTLASSSNLTAVDWDSGINFTLSLGENTAISNPSNGQPGTFRTIYVVGASGTRTVTFGANFLGEIPTIADVTTTKAYLLSIYCLTTSHFVVSAKRALG